MSLVGLLVTICLLLGMGIVIGLVLFFPYSTVNQSSWEPVFRSYDENIKAVSKSHLLTALLDRYERYVRPLVSPPAEGKAPLPLTRSPEYLETSQLLQKMVNPKFAFTKMFAGNEQVFVLSVRTFDVFSDEFKPQGANMNKSRGNFSPLVGKVVLFRIPEITLLNKNESLNLTSNEAMGLNACWSAFLPGSPVDVAFSNDYKQLAFAYRIIVPGGVRYRIRYYPRIECNPEFSEEPYPDYYYKYANLTLNETTEYTPHYDDVYVPAYSYVSSLAVAENTVAYSMVYDVFGFRVVEMHEGVWKERADVPLVRRGENVYEFCNDLMLVPREDASTLLVAFSRRGNSLSSLSNHIQMFERSANGSELVKLYTYSFPLTISIVFSLADLESPPEVGSLFAVNSNKDLAFVSKTNDRTFYMELPQERNQSVHVPVAVNTWLGNRAIAALDDLSIVATYGRDANNILFYASSNGSYLGSKEMSLSQLPKSLHKKAIVDMVLLDNEMHSGWKESDILLALLFEGGDILKIFVNKDELIDINEWTVSFMEFPSSSLITMLVTSLLILIPLFLGLRISFNREGVGNIFAQQNNPPPQPQPQPRPANN